MRKKKRVALIGYGGMARWHVNYFLKSDVASLAGIWDTDAEKRELARQRDIFVYSSLEAVLFDDSVDIVAVITPNDVHMPIAAKALEAGKNVIYEKNTCLHIR